MDEVDLVLIERIAITLTVDFTHTICCDLAAGNTGRCEPFSRHAVSACVTGCNKPRRRTPDVHVVFVEDVQVRRVDGCERGVSVQGIAAIRHSSLSRLRVRRHVQDCEAVATSLGDFRHLLVNGRRRVAAVDKQRHRHFFNVSVLVPTFDNVVDGYWAAVVTPGEVTCDYGVDKARTFIRNVLRMALVHPAANDGLLVFQLGFDAQLVTVAIELVAQCRTVNFDRNGDGTLVDFQNEFLVQAIRSVWVQDNAQVVVPVAWVDRVEEQDVLLVESVVFRVRETLDAHIDRGEVVDCRYTHGTEQRITRYSGNVKLAGFGEEVLGAKVTVSQVRIWIAEFLPEAFLFYDERRYADCTTVRWKHHGSNRRRDGNTTD